MKKSIIYFLSLLIIGSLISCSNEEAINTTYHVSFDDIAGYCDNPTIVTSTLSHSGLKCVQLNPDNIYGPNYSRKFGDLISFQPKMVRVKAYVRLSTPSSVVKLVCSIDNDSAKTIFWNAIDSKSLNLKSGDWEILEGTFDVTGKTMPGNKLNLYTLHDAGGNILVDDLEISFE